MVADSRSLLTGNKVTIRQTAICPNFLAYGNVAWLQISLWKLKGIYTASSTACNATAQWPLCQYLPGLSVNVLLDEGSGGAEWLATLRRSIAQRSRLCYLC